MTTDRRDVESLFDLVDESMESCPAMSRAILESILEMSPGNQRARRLADALDRDGQGEEASPEKNLMLVIEAAEGLLARGQQDEARSVVAHIRRRHGESEVARRWLEGMELLLGD